jgi:hypothetical protein
MVFENGVLRRKWQESEENCTPQNFRMRILHQILLGRSNKYYGMGGACSTHQRNERSNAYGIGPKTRKEEIQR